jgi:hypothetical protein
VAITDDYAAIVSRLRGWGFEIREEGGCYGRSNGSSWSAGRPVGHVNHHFVCGMSPSQSYIDGLVSQLVNGTVVQWFADVNGRAYLIGTGPMNHAGTGMSSVLNLVKQDQPPPSNPASSSGDISGNPHYSGTECQHPGDSTPWPAPMLDVMVAINAASFLQWGYSANRAINHSEHSNRKIDLAAGGGVNSDGWSAAELRRRVAARMGSTAPGPGPGPTPTPTDDDEDDGMRNLYLVKQSAPGKPADGAIWVHDWQTRRWISDGNRLKDMAWQQSNTTADGKQMVTYWILSGGKYVKFTDHTLTGKADPQTALDQFGVAVGKVP